jgi:Fe-S-cluster containining protein
MAESHQVTLIYKQAPILPIMTKNPKKAEELASQARNALSEFCHTECKAYCCRGGYLLLSKKEVGLLKGNVKDLKTEEDKFVFNLKPGCPNLDGHKCSVHTDPERPKACKEYPVFLFKDSVAVSYGCLGFHLLYPFLARFKRMGYKIDYR